MSIYKAAIYATLIMLITLSKLSAQNSITIGRFDTIVSKVYNETRILRISVPSDIEKGKQEKYPVVFVLDGANHIYSLAGMIHRFSYDEGCEVTPEMIVVGVETKNRYNELVPSTDDDKFSNYLEQELIPFIDKNYPTMPYRVFIGHSLGGLRVIHTALNQPDLFNAYVAVDPSLGIEDNKWYSRMNTKMDSFSLSGKKMFVAMAQTMPTGMVQDLESIKADTTTTSNHMRKIMNFSELMSAKDSDEECFKWEFFSEETHSSITQIGMYHGLKFIYDYYLNRTWPQVLDGNITPKEALSLMINHYKVISDHIGVEIKPTEKLLQMILGAIRRRNQDEKARLFSEYYIKIYPESEKAKELVVKSIE